MLPALTGVEMLRRLSHEEWAKFFNAHDYVDDDDDGDDGALVESWVARDSTYV